MMILKTSSRLISHQNVTWDFFSKRRGEFCFSFFSFWDTLICTCAQPFFLQNGKPAAAIYLHLFLYTIVNSAEKTPPHRKEINPNQQRFVERCPPAGFYRLRFYVFLSHSYQRVSKFTRNFMLHAIKKNMVPAKKFTPSQIRG